MVNAAPDAGGQLTSDVDERHETILEYRAADRRLLHARQRLIPATSPDFTNMRPKQERTRVLRSARDSAVWSSVEDVRKHPTRRAVAKMLEALEALRCIDRRGVFVQIPHAGGWVRFKSKPSLSAAVLPYGERSLVARTPWPKSVSAPQFLVRLETNIYASGAIGGRVGPLLDSVFEHLAQLAALAAEAKLDSTPFAAVDQDPVVHDIQDVIALPNPAWAVTAYGLESTRIRYPIEAHRLREDGWRRQMMGKVWVNIDAFDGALEAAVVLHELIGSSGFARFDEDDESAIGPSSAARLDSSTPSDPSGASSASGSEVETSAVPGIVQPQPRIFIGSSVEGLAVAQALQEGLEYVGEITLWSQGVFGLSGGTLETLDDVARGFDFAILVLSPDDLTQKRGDEKPAARDNVLLELGLFVGALGRRRTFIVHARDVTMHLPTDIAGVTAATFASQRTDGNLTAAVGSVCTKIEREIRRAGRRT